MQLCRCNPQLKLVWSKNVSCHTFLQLRGSHCSIQNLIYNTLLLQATMHIFHPSRVKQNTTLEKEIKFKTKFCFYRQTTNRSSWNVCYNTFISKSKINLELGIQRSMHCKAVANTQVKNNQATQTQLIFLNLLPFQDKIQT